MSIKLVRDRLASYNCRTEIEENHAIREITQEIALAGLGRCGFYGKALLHGGTCLRVFYGLNRFSEDLDFLLRAPDPGFQLTDHLKGLAGECAAYGYSLEITDRSNADSMVRKAFLKDDSIGKVIGLQYSGRTGPPAKIRIKLEVDVNPPAGSVAEMKYLDFPFVASVALQDKPTLFSGKLHALLCREYIKGRDWYDFIWYTSQTPGINYAFLGAALDQQGPWKGQGLVVDKAWVLAELSRKIAAIDWKQAAEDVRRFIPAHEAPSLDLWGAELFMHQLDKLKAGLP
ncbi:MAG: nucleotidyl transferase AbiEii/AbiGii toxin family protein [Planctomycetota bacterium]